MWIMLIKKLPTVVSPPKLSIFWSTPWPGDKKILRQQAKLYKTHGDQYEADYMDKEEIRGLKYVPENVDKILSYFGYEPNWNGARRIVYKGEAIRVFPHEFTPQTNEKMHMWIDEQAYELVPDTIAEDSIVTGVLDSDTKFIYEAALLDGCNHNQAMMTALGMDITLPDSEIIPIGWYRCHPELAAYYCHDWEMEDTDHREQEIDDEIDDPYGEEEPDACMAAVTSPPKKRPRRK